MPPKGGGGKADDKAKKKIVEDKTFGLKNKGKSKKVAQYIKSVQTSVAGGNAKKEREMLRLREEKKKAKEDEEAHKALLGELNKATVKKQNVPVGVDPKSLVCEFYKRGLCTKGSKCRYSHDVAQERKSEKIDIYTDAREGEQGMDDWDEETLRDAVEKKHGPQNATTIICKYFLQAIEEKKYGWFWECPNGGKACMYRHALPPGYVLKSAKKTQEEDQEEFKLTLEEEIEEGRKRLTGAGTPVTPETFAKWKADRKARKEAEAAASKAQKADDFKKGKLIGLSGRDLFEFNPDAFVDDDEAGEETYERAADGEEPEMADEPDDEYGGEGPAGADDDRGPRSAEDEAAEGGEDGVEVQEDLFAGGEDLEDDEEEGAEAGEGEEEAGEEE